ncbi:MAG: hypothetical protein K2G48_02720 [Malacoplasma sp.]|nr:hypothetical protein [Malacoplasma sp.]MDE7087951.1 hypothetical protein [Malacoplasma sp.]
MKKLKWFKGLALSAFVGITAISLVACGGGSNATHSFTSDPTNYLDANNSPLNGTFNNSPTSTYGQTQLYSLTGYQTTGKFVFEDGEFKQTTNDTLILEGASAVVVFANEDVMKDVDNKLGSNLLEKDGMTKKEIMDKLKDIKTSVEKTTVTPSTDPTTPTQQTQADETSTDDTNADDTDTTSKWNEGTDYWIFTRDKGGIQFQNGLDKEPSESVSDYYNNAVSKGVTYQFVIDTDNKWVDGKGNPQQDVSSKDFERGLETYTLASAIGYTRNSYFLELIGLGKESLGKTVSYKASESSDYVNPSDKNYDISNFANKNDAVYTMYIDEPYPYTLDLITKEYFGPLPYTNKKVENISLKSGKIVLSDSGKIDDQKTNFNEIFGSGAPGVFTEGTWYAGAYYVSAFTSTQIIFNLNHTYMETVGKHLLSYVDGKVLGDNNQNTDERMEQVVINYGSGSADTYFENFKAGQIDYLASVPEARRSEANSLRSSIVPTKIIQTTRSNYIAYTPNPYVVDANGQVADNNFLVNMAQFIYQWDNKDSMIVRAGIAGLINYYRLADLVYADSKDFQLSATPYGAFKNYYESVAKGNLYGALPRPYNDYKEAKEDTLSGFEMSFYSWDSSTSTVKIEKQTIDKKAFTDAIKNIINNNENIKAPLQFNIKFGEQTFTANYRNFVNKLKETIEDLSDNQIKVDYKLRDSVDPSYTQWYNNQSSPFGWSYWSPDYNGVGTWIEANNTLESTTAKNVTYEGVPGTNAHNAFHTFLTSMVYAVKLMKYTWDSSNNKYKAPESTEQASGDPYANDIKVQKAFSDTTLSDFSINTSDSLFNGKNTPGERYGALAIELLNLLIEKNVFDQSKFDAYVTDPSKLLYVNNKPDVANLYLGGDVIKAGQSANFSKYLGVFAGQSTAKALYENTVLDSDYSFIPRAEAGLNERIITLVNPNYVARSGTQSINWRDFGVKNK